VQECNRAGAFEFATFAGTRSGLLTIPFSSLWVTSTTSAGSPVGWPFRHGPFLLSEKFFDGGAGCLARLSGTRVRKHR
jgi:hypothetical protein